MAAWERQTEKSRRKLPSFSSTLLDAIYNSTDESKQGVGDYVHNRRNNAAKIEQEIESLRRAIMVEKWMENYSTPRHFPSNSGSSTDSSIFSSSETESYISRSSVLPLQKHEGGGGGGRFTRTKSRAMKIYGDLKKVKEPISPGGKITNFLNSIFSPRNLKKKQGNEEWNSVRKSRSMHDTKTCSLSSRSCLSKNPSSKGNKSKRSVRFCPVNVILDEGHKNIYDYDEYSISASMPTIGSQFIKKNIDSFRLCEGKNLRKHEFRDLYENESDVDDKSCASSDLFELENIGRVYEEEEEEEEELPVYETTSLEMNKAIANGLVM